jgi:hypothetical protein
MEMAKRAKMTKIEENMLINPFYTNDLRKKRHLWAWNIY